VIKYDPSGRRGSAVVEESGGGESVGNERFHEGSRVILVNRSVDGKVCILVVNQKVAVPIEYETRRSI
jgi:hypothetical protein